MSAGGGGTISASQAMGHRRWHPVAGIPEVPEAKPEAVRRGWRPVEETLPPSPRSPGRHVAAAPRGGGFGARRRRWSARRRRRRCERRGASHRGRMPGIELPRRLRLVAPVHAPCRAAPPPPPPSLAALLRRRRPLRPAATAAAPLSSNLGEKKRGKGGEKKLKGKRRRWTLVICARLVGATHVRSHRQHRRAASRQPQKQIRDKFMELVRRPLAGCVVPE
ncbi:hypothetical protein PVAP13_4KG163805 [Panicum virgatum]|uniref:Uncharacterized protein n=1 Tax=Panicum virgatum TaxID=38727 RepID=A0A8T0THT2_PANVG|nr:hypothetical protein PVAP13_4KG163805 [Panicum virgatum]